jgi:hypothetical protein
VRVKKRIAVLLHKDQPLNALRGYAIAFLAEFWRDDGLSVEFVRGVERFVPADVVIVHVDLSVVPDAYLEFARQYPIAVNGAVKDIRKSTFSRQRLTRNSEYVGRVIVKTNLNHAGYPERALAAASGSRNERTWLRRLRAARHFEAPSDYRLYGSIGKVPRRFFDEERFIVERFLPEVHDGLYCVRALHFLGDRVQCNRVTARDPIVNSHTKVASEGIEPDPKALDLRRELNIDYGKFDYVVRDGEVCLFDVNKTTGAGPNVENPEVRARRQYRAKGIYAYL